MPQCDKTVMLCFFFRYFYKKDTLTLRKSTYKILPINCYSEWEEEIKVYDKELLSEFIKQCFLNNGISFDD